MDAEKLRLEREKMYTDLYHNVIPERFPVHDSITWNFLIEYSGKSLMEVQCRYDTDECIEILEKGMEILRGDNAPAAGGHYGVALMLNQNQQSVMGTTGMIQHPEREYMKADEYDAFIENPYDFFLEKISPRLNASYAKSEVDRQFAFARTLLCQLDVGARTSKANKFIADKYGYYSPPPGSGAHQYIPFDFLADHCRGFSKIPMDIRRQPDKVLAACDALMPFCLWSGQNPVDHPNGSNMIPTHMAAYLRTKDLEKFYWPTFKQVVHKTAERGQAMTIFIENDWDRYVDFLEEMPMGTRMYMEYGDPKKFKDKLGKKHVLAGFYPLTMFLTATKEQCIDKAKEILDIMAPGGNFYFLCDKSALTLNDINVENYVATMEYVREHSKNDNAGQLVNPTMKREDTIVHYEFPEFKSKYIVPYDEYKKEYPPVSESIEPYMRAGYDKYNGMLRLRGLHNL